VAKLDRLSRHAATLLLMAEAGVPIICVDNPSMSHLVLGVLACVAQGEAKAISDRTKAALAAKKARGFALGSARKGHWSGREHLRLAGGKKGRARASVVRSQLAQQAREEVAPIILGLKSEGLTLAAIAERLNRDGWATRRGQPWRDVTVCKLLGKIEADEKGGEA
jgi:DNA invertase Pin-like site-specific DNA recombinase